MFRLAEPNSWFRVAEIDAKSPDQAAARAQLGLSGDAIRGEPRLSEPVVASLLTTSGIEESLEKPLEILAGLGTYGGSNRYVTLAFALDEDAGSATALGVCDFYAVTQPLSELASRIGVPPSTLIAEYAERGDASRLGEELSAATSTSAPPPTVPGDPQRRHLPDNPVAELQTGWITFHVPAGWESDELLCTAIPVGWNECVSIALVRAEGGSVTLPIRLDDRFVFDVWLLDPGGDITRPIARLGSVDPSTALRDAQAEQVGDVPHVVVAFRDVAYDVARSSGRDGDVALLAAASWER